MVSLFSIKLIQFILPSYFNRLNIIELNKQTEKAKNEIKSCTELYLSDYRTGSIKNVVSIFNSLKVQPCNCRKL